MTIVNPELMMSEIWQATERDDATGQLDHPLIYGLLTKQRQSSIVQKKNQCPVTPWLSTDTYLHAIFGQPKKNVHYTRKSAVGTGWEKKTSKWKFDRSVSRAISYHRAENKDK